MSEYQIRRAQPSDIELLVETIIQSEKSGTDRCGLCTLFNLPEHVLRTCLSAILKEEIDGCEFSISSFLVTTFLDQPVAALGGWYEGMNESELPSGILKANLIRCYFPKESIEFFQERSDLVSDFQINREHGTWQLEYAYVEPKHRGNRLIEKMELLHFQIAKQLYPQIQKSQTHPYDINLTARHLHEKLGFKVIKQYSSNNKELLKYFPSTVLLLMEREM